MPWESVFDIGEGVWDGRGCLKKIPPLWQKIVEFEKIIVMQFTYTSGVKQNISYNNKSSHIFSGHYKNEEESCIEYVLLNEKTDHIEGYSTWYSSILESDCNKVHPCSKY